MGCPIELSPFAAIYLLGEKTNGPHTNKAVLMILASFEIVVDHDADSTTTRTNFSMEFIEPEELPDDYKIYKDSFIQVALNQTTAEQLTGASLEMEDGVIIFRHYDFKSGTVGIEELNIYN